MYFSGNSFELTQYKFERAKLSNQRIIKSIRRISARRSHNLTISLINLTSSQRKMRSYGFREHYVYKSTFLCALPLRVHIYIILFLSQVNTINPSRTICKRTAKPSFGTVKSRRNSIVLYTHFNLFCSLQDRKNDTLKVFRKIFSSEIFAVFFAKNNERHCRRLLHDRNETK